MNQKENKWLMKQLQKKQFLAADGIMEEEILIAKNELFRACSKQYGGYVSIYD